MLEQIQCNPEYFNEDLSKHKDSYYMDMDVTSDNNQNTYDKPKPRTRNNPPEYLNDEYRHSRTGTTKV